MYKAIEHFKDLKDSNYVYNVGDVYPRQGHIPSASRIAELLSAKNKRGRAVIAEIEEVEEVKEIVEPEQIVEPVEDKPKRKGRRKDAE